MPEKKSKDTHQAVETGTNYSSSSWYNAGLKVANFAVLVTASTGIITLVQSPLATLGLNKIKEGRFLPSLSMGVLPVVRFLYRGIGSHLAASSLRTGYVSGVKKFGPGTGLNEGPTVEETVREKTMESKTDGKKSTEYAIGLRGFVMAVSLGEVAVTQSSNTFSDLTKLGIINKGFKWHHPYNFLTLSTTRIGARFGSTLISFASLCMLEEQVHQAIPLHDGPTKHLLSGAVSGMAAAIVSLPFVSYRYIALSKVKVNGQGQLMTPTILSLANDTMTYVKTTGARDVVRDVAKHIAEQLPLRIMRTASTFAVICAIDAALGKEPLARLGLFSRPDERTSSDASVVAVSDESPTPSAK